MAGRQAGRQEVREAGSLRQAGRKEIREAGRNAEGKGEGWMDGETETERQRDRETERGRERGTQRDREAEYHICIIIEHTHSTR